MQQDAGSGREETFRSALRGTNAEGVRDHNQRLVLTLIRRHGPLPKAQIARASGLSAQTVSVIVRALEAERLLARGDPIRGKVGQPSVPIALNPDGAFFFGLKIGRRSAELALVDFRGQVLSRLRLTYRFPVPPDVLRFVEDGIRQLEDGIGQQHAARIAGLGIAMPFRIWEWARVIGLPDDAMAAWRETDIRAGVEALSPWPVYLENDASSACGAELVFGTGDRPADFLYFYVGYFVGGGVVLRHTLFTGQSGNAGALGSMPVPAPDGRVVQLIELASLSALEARMRAQGQDATGLWDSPDGWAVNSDIAEDWIATAAHGLAHAIGAASSVIDVEAAVIDGWLPADLRGRLVAETAARLGRVNLAGVLPPRVRAGSVGPDARILGAASLPLSERFLANFAGTIADA